MERATFSFFNFFHLAPQAQIAHSKQHWRIVINFLTEWYCVSFRRRVEIFYAISKWETLCYFRELLDFHLSYFESGSRKDTNLSPQCLCILEFHCILWQAVLNIILHISSYREKLIIGFGLFSLYSFTAENSTEIRSSSGIVDRPLGQCLFL